VPSLVTISRAEPGCWGYQRTHEAETIRRRVIAGVGHHLGKGTADPGSRQGLLRLALGATPSLQGGSPALPLGWGPIGRGGGVQVAQLSQSELERARAMPVLMEASLFCRIADEDVLASDVDVAAATWASIKLVGHRHRELDRVPVEVDPRQTPSTAGEGGTVGHGAKIRCSQINLRGRCPAGSGRAPGA
jgi:hypothetical protein